MVGFFHFFRCLGLRKGALAEKMRFCAGLSSLFLTHYFIRIFNSSPPGENYFYLGLYVSFFTPFPLKGRVGRRRWGGSGDCFFLGERASV